MRLCSLGRRRCTRALDDDAHTGAAYHLREAGRQIAVAAVALLVREPEPCGDGPRLLHQLRIGQLREIDHAAVMTEILAGELGMAVDPETIDDEALEVPYQEIGEVKRAGLRVGQRREDV